MTNNTLDIIQKYDLDILLTEEDFERVSQIATLLKRRNMKWVDVIELINNFQQSTRTEDKKDRTEKIIMTYIEAKGGEYYSDLTRQFFKNDNPKRPEASSTGIANEIALQYGMTSLGVQKILKKVGVWISSRKTKEEVQNDQDKKENDTYNKG